MYYKPLNKTWTKTNVIDLDSFCDVVCLIDFTVMTFVAGFGVLEGFVNSIVCGWCE